MEVTEASVEVMEALTQASSTAGIMEASVEAFMQDMEYMKSSVNVHSTGASTKVSTKAFIQVISTKASMEAFMSVMEAFVEVMESFMEMTSTEFFMEAFVEASMKTCNIQKLPCN